MIMQRVTAYDVGVSRLGEQLIEVHQTLRERLAALRQEIADGAARPGLPGDLPGHGLSFCGAQRWEGRGVLAGVVGVHRGTEAEAVAVQILRKIGAGPTIRHLMAQRREPLPQCPVSFD